MSDYHSLKYKVLNQVELGVAEPTNKAGARFDKPFQR